ncbi:LOW QUALITY PROTEIN: hypothetical protein TorRG33x02_205050 [Trema orientale]|uniref:Secreted protein n=1 Tax=Trema orientale TaxID=63057 RepID=A0A2P5EDT1_TREOI|nr:LOW QUALITY PROTEIN: hypothetical protein TorRG33x02_205050 [Trema orientale]
MQPLLLELCRLRLAIGVTVLFHYPHIKQGVAYRQFSRSTVVKILLGAHMQDPVNRAIQNKGATKLIRTSSKQRSNHQMIFHEPISHRNHWSMSCNRIQVENS